MPVFTFFGALSCLCLFCLLPIIYLFDLSEPEVPGVGEISMKVAQILEIALVRDVTFKALLNELLNPFEATHDQHIMILFISILMFLSSFF